MPHGPDLYSTDRVHPNALGHARIAERVRGYLSRLPRDRAYASDYDCQAVRARGVLPAARRSMPVARDGAVASRAAGALVDDSPTPHLVHKHGWATTTPGANLTLAIPPGVACGSTVTLAYLMSNFTGPFRITCAPGCACTKIRTYHQWRVFPFPVVTGKEEWTGVCQDCDRRNVKLTHDTAFDLLRERGDAPCRVTVTPLTRRAACASTGSTCSTPSGDYLAHARHSPPSTAAQRRFGGAGAANEVRVAVTFFLTHQRGPRQPRAPRPRPRPRVFYNTAMVATVATASLGMASHCCVSVRLMWIMV